MTQLKCRSTRGFFISMVSFFQSQRSTPLFLHLLFIFFVLFSCLYHTTHHLSFFLLHCVSSVSNKKRGILFSTTNSPISWIQTPPERSFSITPDPFALLLIQKDPEMRKREIRSETSSCWCFWSRKKRGGEKRAFVFQRGEGERGSNEKGGTKERKIKQKEDKKKMEEEREFDQDPKERHTKRPLFTKVSRFCFSIIVTVFPSFFFFCIVFCQGKRKSTERSKK